MKKSFSIFILLSAFACKFTTPSPNNVVSEDVAMSRTGVTNPEQAVALATTQQGIHSVLAPYIEAVMKAEKERCSDKYPMDDWRKTKIYAQVLEDLQSPIHFWGKINEDTSAEEYVELLSGKYFLEDIENKLQSNFPGRKGRGRGFAVEDSGARSTTINITRTVGEIPTKEQCFCDRFDYFYYHHWTEASENKNKVNGSNGSQTIDVEFEVTKKSVKEVRANHFGI